MIAGSLGQAFVRAVHEVNQFAGVVVAAAEMVCGRHAVGTHTLEASCVCSSGKTGLEKLQSVIPF
jgi:hypothetical protein